LIRCRWRGIRNSSLRAVGFFGLATGYLIYGPEELFKLPARKPARRRDDRDLVDLPDLRRHVEHHERHEPSALRLDFRAATAALTFRDLRIA
jgi:hypothetical protein